MTHIFGVPALLLFAVLSFFILRSRRVSWIDFWVFILTGYYLGGTGLGDTLGGIVNAVFHVIGGGS